jgi:hypothetical protein
MGQRPMLATLKNQTQFPILEWWRGTRDRGRRRWSSWRAAWSGICWHGNATSATAPGGAGVSCKTVGLYQPMWLVCTITLATTSVTTPRAVSPSTVAASRRRLLPGRVGVVFGSLVQSLYQTIDQALWRRPLTHGPPGRLSDPVDMPVRRVAATHEPLVIGDVRALQRIEGACYLHLVQASAFCDLVYGNEVVAGLVEHAYNRLKDRKVAA